MEEVAQTDVLVSMYQVFCSFFIIIVVVVAVSAHHHHHRKINLGPPLFVVVVVTINKQRQGTKQIITVDDMYVVPGNYYFEVPGSTYVQ